MQSDTESMTKGEEDAEEGDEVEGLAKEEAAEEDGGAPLEEEEAKALNLANQSLLLHVCAALLPCAASPLSSDTSAANSPMVHDVSIGIPPLPPVKAAAGSFCCCCCC